MSATRSRAYFLRSERLGFGTWEADDVDLALGLWGDPAVTRLFGGPFTEAQVRERLAREMATQAEHGVQYWPVFLLDDGAHVGCCGLRPYDEEGVLELGFHLRPAYWRQGYGSEAARAVIDYAFDVLGVRALVAGHHPQNEASRRLLARLGFRYLRDEFYAPTGLMHPSYRLDRPCCG